MSLDIYLKRGSMCHLEALRLRTVFVVVGAFGVTSKITTKLTEKPRKKETNALTRKTPLRLWPRQTNVPLELTNDNTHKNWKYVPRIRASKVHLRWLEPK